jgi:hypothetical protein
MKYGPANGMIFTAGNTNHMVANCDVLITQYSTVSYVGIELGKEVHSYFDVDELRRLSPYQNNGTSAQRIAAVCRGYVQYKGSGVEYLRSRAGNLYNTDELAWAG